MKKLLIIELFVFRKSLWMGYSVIIICAERN